MRTPEDGATITAPPSQQADRFAWERALDAADLPYKTIAVALAFATFADRARGTVTVSVHKVERRAHMPESTVRKHLTILRDTGWLRRTYYGSDGGTSNSADVHVLTVPAAVTVPEQADPPAAEHLADVTAAAAAAAAAIVVPPAPDRRHRSPVNTAPPARSSTAHPLAVPAPTTAHPLAQVQPDHRSPVSEAPLASERTTASQLAPIKPYQGSIKAAAAVDLPVVDAEPRPGRPDPYRPTPPAPRCPIHSDVPPGEWVPDGCHDCALLGRAHRHRHSDDARAEVRARRACTECTPFGLLLGLDGALLDNGRGGGIRCAHPTVPDEVWAGETSSAPPSPPPVEAPVDEPGGRHRLRAPLPDNLVPEWRPSPRPRDQRSRVTA